MTEQREKPRMIETVFSLLAAPVSWLFKLKIYIPSDVVGKSLSRVAADTSIKPLDPKDIKTSNSGSVTYAFSGADMLDMEAKAKQ